MKKETYKIILATLFSFAIFFMSLNLTFAASPAINGLNVTANCGYDKTQCTKEANGSNVNSGIAMQDVPTTIGKIIGTGLSFIGIIFFALMIYGGFSWMLARGDSGKVQTAKDLIEAAVIGLIIVLAAYAVTEWLGTQLTKK